MSAHKIIVQVKSQTAEVYQGERRLRSFVISTSMMGLGNEVGSMKTPTGVLRVAEKIGDGATLGSVFKARIWTGERWSEDANNPLSRSTEDLVLTRILWLEGTQPENAATLSRYIYLHGTNQEHLLGQPVSHGCIRFSNTDIVDLFDLVPVGTLVEIVP